MTIEREKFDGMISFVCDVCGEVDETHCEEFSGAMAKFKSHGGRAVKVGEDWEHRCKGCPK